MKKGVKKSKKGKRDEKKSQEKVKGHSSSKFDNPNRFKKSKFSSGGKPNPAKNPDTGFNPAKFKVQHKG